MMCMYADVSMRTLAHSICHTCSMEHHETGRDDKELASVCIEAEKEESCNLCVAWSVQMDAWMQSFCWMLSLGMITGFTSIVVWPSFLFESSICVSQEASTEHFGKPQTQNLCPITSPETHSLTITLSRWRERERERERLERTKNRAQSDRIQPSLYFYEQ